MMRNPFPIILNLFSYSIWILIIIHLYKGLENILTKELNWWQITLIGFQLSFEIIVFVQINFLLISIIKVYTQRSTNGVIQQLNEFPTIDVYIPTKNVDPDILEMTILGVYENNYPKDKLHIYLADDTENTVLINAYQRLCDKYKVQYIHDPTNKKYKAGMLNIALPKGNSKYVSFFDYDQIPEKGILKRFANILENYPDISYVQAKKTFRQLDSIYKVWSALLYALYFEIFERSKQQNQTVLFAGSTACFRRSTLQRLGGLPVNTFTEDNGLSVSILIDGGKGYYYEKSGSNGMVPATFPLQISQLWRWSHGAAHVLHHNFRRIIKSKKLNFGQKIDIIGTLGISPMVVAVYIYGLTFLPLIITGIDSSRLVIYNFSTIALIPILSALVYAILAMTAIHFSKEDHQSEFRYSHLPGFLFIALASNLLVITSGISGLLGILGPNSEKGYWTKKVSIELISIIGFITGIVIEYFAIQWYLNGFVSAILFIILGITLLPGIFVTFYYKIKEF